MKFEEIEVFMTLFLSGRKLNFFLRGRDPGTIATFEKRVQEIWNVQSFI